MVFAVFGGYFLFVLITESFYSRMILAAAVMLSAIFIALSFILKAPIQKSVLAIVAATTLLLQALGPKPTEYLTQALGLGPKPQVSKKVINTLLYSVNALTFSHYFDVCSTEHGRCRKPGNGGGISRFLAAGAPRRRLPRPRPGQRVQFRASRFLAARPGVVTA